jgi:hypothetical protein
MNTSLVAVDFDLRDRDTGAITTLRICSAGEPVVATVGSDRVQYEPSLIPPVLIGHSIPADRYGEPMRGAQSAGQIVFILKESLRAYLDDYTWDGNTFRVYEGEAGPVDDFNLVFTGRIAGVSQDKVTLRVTVTTAGAGLDLNRPFTERVYGEEISDDLPDFNGSAVSTAGNTVSFTGTVDLPAYSIVAGDYHIWTSGLAAPNLNTPMFATAVTTNTITYDVAVSGSSGDWAFSRQVPDSLQGRPMPQLFGSAMFTAPDNLDMGPSPTPIFSLTRQRPTAELLAVRVGGVPWRVLDPYSVQRDNADVDTTPGFEGITVTGSGNVATFIGGGIDLTVDPGIEYGDRHFWTLGLFHEFPGEPLTVLAVTADTITYDAGIGGASGDWAFHQDDPDVGEAKANHGRGEIEFGGQTMGGEVRADAQSYDWEDMTTAYMMEIMIEGMGGTVDAAAFAALEAAFPVTVGYWVHDPVNAADVLDDIMTGAGGWWAETFDGEITVGLTEAPAGSSAYPAYTDIDIASCSLMKIIQPAWRVKMGWQRRWVPATQFLDAVTPDDRHSQSLAELVRPPSLQDFTILSRYPKAPSPAIHSLVVFDGQDADDIGTRLFDAWSLERRMYELQVWRDPEPLYSTIEIDYPGVINAIGTGFFRVVGVIRSIGGGPSTIQVWG